MSRLLRTVLPAQVARRQPADADTAVLARAGDIIEDVRRHGESALRRHATELDGLAPGAELVLGPRALATAWAALPTRQQQLLERLAHRIEAFATAQRRCLADLSMTSANMTVGHQVSAVSRAGAYAPGGRHPLPSSVLMTCVPARVAGVEEIWLASPRPALPTLAAAHLAGVRGVVAAGGAQAIAALAHGAGAVPACDVVVGPGNRWVAAAKRLIAAHTRIDLIAGPSELAILADDSAPAAWVAADLLAQAEHDPDAFVALVTTSAPLADAVEEELALQLLHLPTAATARAALGRGMLVPVSSMEEGARICDRLATEHLQVMSRNAGADAARCSLNGALFVGADIPQVLGDYGAGPNHTLPTGGAARTTGGLSVFHFLCIRTFIRPATGTAAAAGGDTGADAGAGAAALLADAVELARLEGLEGHARAALLRRTPG